MKDTALPSIPTVSEADWEKIPTSVKGLVESLVSRVEELETQFEELRAENAQLRVENEWLKEKLQRNSQNSSQPPSEDKAKGFKSKKRRSRRPRGGQSGHAGKGPKLYPPDACDETGFRQGNGDGKNPQKRKGWLWVVVTPLVSYFSVFLSRSQTVAKEILGDTFGGIVDSDRCGSYSWLCNDQRQVCWAHIKRDFTKIAERTGRSANLGKALLNQQKRLFECWYQVCDGILTRGDFMMTTVTNLKAQQRPIFAFLSDAVNASHHSSPVPSLIPEGDCTP